MKVLLTAFSFLLVLVSSAQKKAEQSSGTASIFDNYISHAMPLWKVPGLSVAVVKNGTVVFIKGYGVKETEKSEPFTTSTLAICASTTKAMTAVCLAMLVDEGKLKWNDKLGDVLPQLTLNDAYAASQISVKDLLTHNTGLGNADFLWVERYSNDEIIRRMRNIPAAYSFRSSFLYQNLMYLVAGEVIHAVSGKPWADFITERLFKPLQMQHTYALPSLIAKEEKRMSLHYMYPDSTVKSISYIPYDIGAPGGVWSNAEDISKWMLFMLDSTKINGRPLLKAQTYAELLKPQVIGGGYPTEAVIHQHWNTYGLGWFQHDYKGKMLQYHTGSLAGATAIIGLLPEDNFGVYIFGNLDHAELRHALMYKAIDLWCFNDNSRDWSSELFKLYSGINREEKAKRLEKEKGRIANTHPTLSLPNYTGSYENATYGKAEIIQRGDSLQLQFPGDLLFTLSHWHYDTFAAQSKDSWSDKSWVQFSLNDKGKIEHFDFDGILYKKKEKANEIKTN